MSHKRCDPDVASNAAVQMPDCDGLTTLSKQSLVISADCVVLAQRATLQLHCYALCSGSRLLKQARPKLAGCRGLSVPKVPLQLANRMAKGSHKRKLHAVCRAVAMLNDNGCGHVWLAPTVCQCKPR